MKQLLAIFLAMFSFSCFAGPSSLQDFKNVTVTIHDANNRSGGSGTIIQSNNTGSIILTNEHVCSLTDRGGTVQTHKGSFAVQKVLKYKDHDLCLIYVAVNLEVSAKVAKNTPKLHEAVKVSGHPYLMPHMVSSGNLSGPEQISMMVDVAPCTEKDYKQTPGFCIFFGGIPVIRTYNTVTTNILIAPGNSGSAVYNSSGEIVALVFAGVGRGMSPGYLVPHEYIVDFMNKTKKAKWTNVAKPVKITETRTRRATEVFEMDIEKLLKINITPAIVNSSLDKTYEKLQMCKGMKKCVEN